MRTRAIRNSAQFITNGYHLQCVFRQTSRFHVYQALCSNSSMSDSQNHPRAFLLRTLHQWHWISSALCLLGLLVFTITGFTLNHAGQISADPKTRSARQVVPQPLLTKLQEVAKQTDARASLPPPLRAFLADSFDLRIGMREAEWSEDEIYLSLPRPGGDGWVAIDLTSGEVEYELTERGWIAYFNDLHKGRNTGAAWRWFIDVFALACLVFSITGLWLLKLHAKQRGLTWPMVGLGGLVPLLIALLLIH